MHSAASRTHLQPARAGRTARARWFALGLALFAWLAVLAWSASPFARHLDHAYQPRSAPEYVAALTLFLTGWTLMVVAMMLPTAIQLFERFDEVVGGRRDRRLLVSLLTAGFVLNWLAIGFAFRVGDAGIHRAVASLAWLDERPQLIGGAVLIGAAVYQFTPLKYRCLTACRSPQSFIYRYWRGGRASGHAFRIGIAYGVSCVGCCWTLMLVTFALGATSLIWMFAFASVMVVEKTATFGSRMIRPVGVALFALGSATVLGIF